MAKFSGFRYAKNQRSKRLQGVWLVPDKKNFTETLSTQVANITVNWDRVTANSLISFTSTGSIPSLPDYNIGTITKGNVKLSTTLPAGTNVYEGIRTYNISASISNVILHSTNINLVDATPTFTFSANAGPIIFEGNSIRFSITSTNVPDFTDYYWTNDGSSTAADFSTPTQSSGNITFINNQANIGFAVLADFTTDDLDFVSLTAETLILKLRSGSTNGPIVATANTVFITDSSLTSASIFSISPNVVSGSQLTTTFTLAGYAFDFLPNVYVRTAANVDFLASSIVRFTNSSINFTLPRNFTTTESPLSIYITQLSNSPILTNSLSVLPATITSVSPTNYSGASGTSFSLTGTNFDTAAAQVYMRSSGNVDYLTSNIVRTSATNITFRSPRNFTLAESPISIYLMQPSNNALLANVITPGNAPLWVTGSGTLASTYSLNQVVSTSVTATDSDGQTVSYSIVSGGLPSGVGINASTGVISGTISSSVETDTTHTFTVRATDSIGNFSDRVFSILQRASIVAVYSFTGGDQSFTVPSGVTRVTFKLWGAGGTATVSLTSFALPFGGDGGFTQSTLATSGGTTYTVIVGQSTFNRNGGLNYGGGRSGNYDGSYGGGDGGGRSAIRIGSTEILTAGGGGGGGMYWMTGPHPAASPGGVGGGLVGGGGGGYAWTAAGDGRTAGGGTQTAGGIGAKHQGPPPNTGDPTFYTVRQAPGNGAQFSGGPVASTFSGGGGGGGWYGGGGGTGERYQDSGTRWGGGGGSGWVGRDGANTLSGTNYGAVGDPQDLGGRTDTVNNVTYYNTITIQGRNSGDANYGGNAGTGAKDNLVGGHGRIVIIY